VDADEYFVPNDISAAKKKEIGLSDSDLVIGTVARLNYAKALEYMLQAFAIARKEFPAAKCLIVGDGELRRELEGWARDLGIEADTLFLGARTDVPELLSLMDIFVLSSITEGTPVSLLEAVVAKVPAVCTGVGGIPEVIENNVTGVLVPPRDVEKLAEGIINLLSDNSLRTRVIDNAYAKVREKYSLDVITRQVEDIYDRCYGAKMGNRV
jgi:glycosyltransferase involved in cell wall biosynthesis